MALGTLTTSEPVLIGEDGLVNAQRVLVTANAAEARMLFLLSEAERMERVMNRKENPRDDDNLQGGYHVSAADMVKSYLAQAEIWEVRARTATVQGRPQLAAATNAGAKLQSAYHRDTAGKGRF